MPRLPQSRDSKKCLQELPAKPNAFSVDTAQLVLMANILIVENMTMHVSHHLRDLKDVCVNLYCTHGQHVHMISFVTIRSIETMCMYSWPAFAHDFTIERIVKNEIMCACWPCVQWQFTQTFLKLHDCCETCIAIVFSTFEMLAMSTG